MATEGYGPRNPDMTALEARVIASGDPELIANPDGARNTLGFVQTAQDAA